MSKLSAYDLAFYVQQMANKIIPSSMKNELQKHPKILRKRWLKLNLLFLHKRVFSTIHSRTTIKNQPFIVRNLVQKKMLSQD